MTSVKKNIGLTKLTEGLSCYFCFIQWRADTKYETLGKLKGFFEDVATN